MTRIFAAALILSLPVAAQASPIFLPDLTFPEPVGQPDVSSQGCAAPQTTACR